MPNRNQAPPRTIVVDDEALFRMTLATLMRARGFATLEAADGVDALDQVERGQVDSVVVDLEMPRLGGVELLAELLSRGHFMRVYVVSAYVSRSESCGVSIWTKPVEVGELITAVSEQAGTMLSLKTVAVTAASSKRSSIVSVTFDDGTIGKLWVTEGRIAAAEATTRDDTLAGGAAAVDLLARPGGARVSIERMGSASIETSFRSRAVVSESLSEIVWTAKAYGTARGWSPPSSR